MGPDNRLGAGQGGRLVFASPDPAHQQEGVGGDLAAVRGNRGAPRRKETPCSWPACVWDPWEGGVKPLEGAPCPPVRVIVPSTSTVPWNSLTIS